MNPLALSRADRIKRGSVISSSAVKPSVDSNGMMSNPLLAMKADLAKARPAVGSSNASSSREQGNSKHGLFQRNTMDVTIGASSDDNNDMSAGVYGGNVSNAARRRLGLSAAEANPLLSKERRMSNAGASPLLSTSAESSVHKQHALGARPKTLQRRASKLAIATSPSQMPLLNTPVSPGSTGAEGDVPPSDSVSIPVTPIMSPIGSSNPVSPAALDSDTDSVASSASKPNALASRKAKVSISGSPNLDGLSAKQRVLVRRASKLTGDSSPTAASSPATVSASAEPGSADDRDSAASESSSKINRKPKLATSQLKLSTRNISSATSKRGAGLWTEASSSDLHSGAAASAIPKMGFQQANPMAKNRKT